MMIGGYQATTPEADVHPAVHTHNSDLRLMCLVFASSVVAYIDGKGGCILDYALWYHGRT